MASLSYSFFVVSLTVLLVSASTIASSTQFINKICQPVYLGAEPHFCIKTLTAYPPAVSATSLLQAAQAALNLGISYAQKCADYAGKAAKANPTLKQQFIDCQVAFKNIEGSLRSSFSELKDDPLTANYDAMICSDYTRIVEETVGKNKDSYSKTIMKMNSMMFDFRGIAVSATVAMGG